jgi:hypothetical protein
MNISCCVSFRPGISPLHCKKDVLGNHHGDHLSHKVVIKVERTGLLYSLTWAEQPFGWLRYLTEFQEPHIRTCLGKHTASTSLRVRERTKPVQGHVPPWLSYICQLVLLNMAAGDATTFMPTATQAAIPCCLCGTAILPNPANMCANCIRSQVDIAEGVQKQVWRIHRRSPVYREHGWHTFSHAAH